jgi:hypothetical protein
MPSSSARAILLVLGMAATSAAAGHAQAQQTAKGFAVERLYPSPAGSPWIVMDDLGMEHGLGGALSLTAGYARDPYRIGGGMERLAVVSNEAFASFGLAITYDRWRLYLDVSAPLVIEGNSGTIGAITFSPHALTLGSNPDTLSDPRLGIEARILGEAASSFRLGLAAELIAPNGNVADYDTDGTFRGMIRALVAGDRGKLSYAGQLGVHVRPLDDPATPGRPQGSELLFGAGGCYRIAERSGGAAAWSASAEIYGATAFASFLQSTTTALEGLVGARLDARLDDRRQLRIKLAAGPGLDQHFGAPEWRVVLAIETLGRPSPHPR